MALPEMHPPVAAAAGVPSTASIPTAVTGLTKRPLAGRFDIAAGSGGIALAALLGPGGSVGWGSARLAALGLGTVALLLLLQRSSPIRRGAVAMVAGVPGVAIALGFAPHLRKGGPMRVQVAMVVLALAAAVLTFGGAALAARGRGIVGRAGAIVGVVVVVATVAFVVGPAVAATNTPHATLGRTPAAVGLPHQDVVLATDDGVSLAAWYVESTNGAAVVLLHGAGSTRSSVLPQAEALARAGFGVLMVDARGHGESGGRAMDFGWHGDRDIAAATAWLARRPDVDANRIGAVGLSMGGEEAIGATASNDALRAVVAEGVTARVAGDEDWLSDRYGLRGALTERLEVAQDLVTDVLTGASRPTSMRDAVARSDAEYLLVAGGAVPDEGHAAAFITSGSPERVRTWTVPGAGHTAGLRTDPAGWSDRVVGFLREVLPAAGDVGGRTP